MLGGVKDLAGKEISSFELVTWPHMITWWEGHLTLRLTFFNHKSPTCQVWWTWVLHKRKYFVFILSCNLMWPRGQKVVWRYGRVLIIISHHPAKLIATGVVQEKIFCFYFVTWPHVTKWSESHVILLVILSLHKWLPCKVLWS